MHLQECISDNLSGVIAKQEITSCPQGRYTPSYNIKHYKQNKIQVVLNFFVGSFGSFWLVLLVIVGGFDWFWLVLAGFGWFRVLVSTIYTCINLNVLSVTYIIVNYYIITQL